MISETRRKATWQELADRVDELQKKLENSISKDKIKEKIEELEVGSEKADGWRSECLYAKEILEELLKGE